MLESTGHEIAPLLDFLRFVIGSGVSRRVRSAQRHHDCAANEASCRQQRRRSIVGNDTSTLISNYGLW